MFADFLGIDNATLAVIGGAVVSGLGAVGAGVWRVLTWCDGKVSYFLDRQDKFMAKLEANDAKRIEILGDISKDNAIKAVAIQSLTSDMKEVKEDVAVLKDRINDRISTASVHKLDK